MDSFEQIKRFNSFDDRNIDHAKLGVQVLFKEGMIRNFIDDDQYDEIIEKGDCLSFFIQNTK